MDFLDPSDSGAPDDDEVTVRPGPLWRHALWVVGVTALGVGLGWAGSLFRLGPDDYGLLAAAPGSPWTYLGAWAVTGLAATAVLRAAAAKVPVPSPGTIAVILLLIGTRLSLGWRPETPELAAMVAGALVLAGIWAAIALRADAVARKAPKPESPGAS
ncbi:hypothetical protein ACTFBT_28905 [Streptomyces microflavus]|uniref:Uncharacterized protein n=2 Tax=Streptomyces microflavus TaxID=1919 RepID=A0A7J0CY34_STRMI|nr:MULTISPECIES: hypothetical protein [Streptomyces]AGK80304.1 hypothetical protein SFUL_5411 [Streptomyces microflavus DSM 40593]MDX2974963.1 hypothetical protein [Streptomyces sp. NRRL_B-2249]GFN07440.1 hypothetical protein Smic_59960 [Streptomyces microflavus]GGX62567.1 hypothetical protein GCM10010298_29040 [Streptomyces microflavus]